MRVCELTGKRPNAANQISHAHNVTRKTQRPNLHWKRVYLPDKGRYIRMRLSTRAIRNINRMGLREYCRRLGIDYNALVSRKLSKRKR